MNKIGLITLFQGNYGSILQCYSTKKYFEENNCVCDVFSEVVPREKKIKVLLRKILYLGFHFIFSRDFYRQYNLARKKTKKANENLGINSIKKMNMFVKNRINPIFTDYDNLKKISKKDNYLAFVSGSDQIWNCLGSVNRIYFLDFVPKEKSISLSASFGMSELPKYCQKEVKRYLGKYNFISVREEDGKKIVDSLINKEVPVLADPVVLMGAKEWRNEYRNCEELLLDKNYILCFFLDEPNEVALDYIKKYSQDVVIYEFGYHYTVMEQFRIKKIDGNPFDFLRLIDNAEKVFTDSFHAIMFSVIFKKNFFAFKRQYVHGISQQSRIDNVLKKYDYLDRMITERGMCFEHFQVHNCDSILKNEREKIECYLSNSVLGNKSEKESIKSGFDCVGCGLCKKVCPVQAIKVKKEKIGYNVYDIDTEKCLGCNNCVKFCSYKKVNIEEKRAFVAYNKNSYTRSKSASGGIFSAIATSFLEKGGVVYGSGFVLEQNNLINQHICIENIEDLYKIVGSKYVEGDISIVYEDIRNKLMDGKLVLVSGTSCQINSLYSYLRDTDKSKLYTIDLICHGVPGKMFFQSYISFIEKTRRIKIQDVIFRKKENGLIKYVLQIKALKRGKWKEYEIPINNSSYYYLFMRGESYREGCYNCEYANLNKPADITLGDYFELEQDYPEIYNKLDVKDVSSVIIHNKKGEKLLKYENIEKYPIDYNVLVNSHPQLRSPTSYSSFRYLIEKIYFFTGYSGIALFYYVYHIGSNMIKKSENLLNRLLKRRPAMKSQP